MYLILNKEHLLPKTQKMYNPILLTLLKMRPHDSQSSRENATPSSGTSPVASYKEVPPPPRDYKAISKLNMQTFAPGFRAESSNKRETSIQLS